MNTEAAMSHYTLEQSEHQRDHDSLAYELLLQRLVREGDVEGMERMLSGGEFDPDHIGRMARRPQKQPEYICVVLITLISRAAAEGGMDREAAYSLADVYLQRLENCRTEGEILALNIQAQREFTAGVRMAREARSRLSYIEACKAYIGERVPVEGQFLHGIAVISKGRIELVGIALGFFPQLLYGLDAVLLSDPGLVGTFCSLGFFF